MLAHLIGDEQIYSNKNIFDNPNPEINTSDENVFGNIFDAPETKDISDKEKTPKIEVVPY